MKDKELLQMLENLGKNSRKSLAASEVVSKGEMDEDTRCSKTIRNIITSHYGLGTNTNTNTKSLAAAAPAPSAERNPSSSGVVVNKPKVLYEFLIKNHNL